jgi:hypothetical protein
VTLRASPKTPNLRAAGAFGAIEAALRGVRSRDDFRVVNRASKRRAKLWADRYHARAPRTPREARNAICYVLQNTRRHEHLEGRIIEPYWIDPCSSGPTFDGWRGRSPVDVPDPVVSAPRSWLLRTGWRRHGLIEVDEIPAAAFR